MLNIPSNSVLRSLCVGISATRRQQAILWLQEMVGDLGLLSDSTEEDLRLCLRNGITLCKLINKVQPGAVLKVSMPTSTHMLTSLDLRILFLNRSQNELCTFLNKYSVR